MQDERVIDIDIRDEMKRSYIDYAMSVIVSRALPDVRDGLKPVHRRILYAMHDLGFTHDKQHRKSARIVGEVLGKYHPHGDSSVYNAMVRMAQPFSLRHTMIDGHGNFGSIDGDSAAAMRYTEARMTPLTAELLKDIDKETVDWTSNFDDTLKEPMVLPARFPYLLVNGSSGIAVGMATSIPPHNLGNVVDTIVCLIDNPEATVDDMILKIQAPDFPTGAEILGRHSYTQAYRTGRGRVIIRSVATMEEIGRGKMAIIISEIPYMVNKSKMLEDIADLVRDKKLDGITDLRDESNREGIRVVIELRKDVNPSVMLNQLYKHTQLQDSFGINMISLVDGQPRLLNLREMVYEYLQHQKIVETRRVTFDLNKALDRAHILEGLKIALDNIDEVIRIIRSAYNDAEARLMERFGLSDVQAKSIVDMRLRRLQGLEREKIEQELNAVMAFIGELRNILADETLLMGIIRDDLIRIKTNYADERRSKITFDYDEIEIEDMIEKHEVTITLTHHGYIKRVPVSTYQIQKRGGRGKTGLTTREEDFVEHIFTTGTHDTLLCFSNKGKVYQLKAYQVPEAGRIAKGTPIVNLLPLDQEECITAIIPITGFNEGYLIMATREGVIKKSELSKFDTSRKTGIIAVNLNEGDELINVRLTTGNDEIMLVTRNGKSIRFKESDVRDMGRLATGVRGIQLEPDDSVVALELVQEGGKLLVISENGYGKRTKLEEYRIQTRGGKGILTYQITEKTGQLCGARVVQDDDDILLINSESIIIRIRVNEISVSGRSTSGVRLMRLENEGRIVSVAKVVDKEEDSDEEEGNESVEKTEL